MVAQPNTLHSVKRQGSKHALLFKVGKCLEENPLVLDIGIFVLHVLVSLSVGSNSAKLSCSNPDQHRGEGGAIGKHGFPTGYQDLFSVRRAQ